MVGRQKTIIISKSVELGDQLVIRTIEMRVDDDYDCDEDDHHDHLNCHHRHQNNLQ